MEKEVVQEVLVNAVLAVRQQIQVLKDHRVHLDQLEMVVEEMVILVHKVHKELLDQLVMVVQVMVPQVLKVHKVLQVYLDQPVKLDQVAEAVVVQVLLVQQVVLVYRVLLVLLGLEVEGQVHLLPRPLFYRYIIKF